MAALTDSLRRRRQTPMARYMAGKISAAEYVRLTRAAARAAVRADLSRAARSVTR